jgi:hypothetical protein
VPCLVIIFCYVLCYGLTALVVTPIQSVFLPEITVFASLVYLPHGVRVLATWAFGWKAIPALVLGAYVSVGLFNSPEDLFLSDPALLGGIIIGSVSAFAAFELVRFFGYDLYFGRLRKLPWKGVIAIGVLASAINSMGQSLVYSGLIGLEKVAETSVVFAFGDLVGLIVCMVTLMFIFRWHRLFGPYG